MFSESSLQDLYVDFLQKNHTKEKALMEAEKVLALKSMFYSVLLGLGAGVVLMLLAFFNVTSYSHAANIWALSGAGFVALAVVADIILSKKLKLSVENFPSPLAREVKFIEERNEVRAKLLREFTLNPEEFITGTFGEYTKARHALILVHLDKGEKDFLSSLKDPSSSNYKLLKGLS